MSAQTAQDAVGAVRFALLYWCAVLAFALGVVTTLGVCRYIRHRKFMKLLRAFPVRPR